MMEERGFERKQARIHGMNGKAWIGIRLKEHDELLAEVPGDTEVPAATMRRFPGRQTFTTVFGSKAKVG
jgi:hypothetical protein